MRIIALKDAGVEMFDNVDKMIEEDQSWIEIDGCGDIKGDIFIVFRDQ